MQRLMLLTGSGGGEVYSESEMGTGRDPGRPKRKLSSPASSAPARFPLQLVPVDFINFRLARHKPTNHPTNGVDKYLLSTMRGDSVHISMATLV